jgi:hypothetical protein
MSTSRLFNGPFGRIKGEGWFAWLAMLIEPVDKQLVFSHLH